jgi:hypothetical protein
MWLCLAVVEHDGLNKLREFLERVRWEWVETSDVNIVFKE